MSSDVYCSILHGHCKMRVTRTLRAQEWAVRHAGRCYTIGVWDVLACIINIAPMQRVQWSESFNRLPDTETAAPGNGVKRISMAEGLLSSLSIIFARQPMSGQPAGDTEHVEAVTCPGWGAAGGFARSRPNLLL